MLKMTKIKLELFLDPEIYKKYTKIYRNIQKVEFLLFLIDTAKLTRNI